MTLALVVRGAGRGFSIIPAGFECEVGMDAWVELYPVVVPVEWRHGCKNI
jgi:hypothetical protein